MEQETTQVSDQTTNDGVEQVETKQQKDQVAYDTYRKVLGEKKKRDEQLQQMAEKLKTLEQKEMEAKGEQQKLIEALRRDLSEKDHKLKEVHQNFAWNNLESQLKTYAASHGCKKPDALVKLMDAADFEGIEVNDMYQVNGDDLARVVNKYKNDYPEFFGRSTPRVEDGTPSNKVERTKSDWKKLPLADKKKMLAKMLNN